MRKAFFLTFALIFIICSVAISEPAFTGSWATVRDLDNSVVEIDILHVFPNNKAYFSRQQFTENSVGEEVKTICSWEQDSDTSFELIGEAGIKMGYYGLINDKRLLTYDCIFARLDFYARETPTPNPIPTITPAYEELK